MQKFETGLRTFAHVRLRLPQILKGTLPLTLATALVAAGSAVNAKSLDLQNGEQGDLKSTATAY